jgi:hypothetical protein
LIKEKGRAVIPTAVLCLNLAYLLSELNRFRAYNLVILRRIFGIQKGERYGRSARHCEMPSYHLLRIVRVMKSRTTRRGRDVACLGQHVCGLKIRKKIFNVGYNEA